MLDYGPEGLGFDVLAITGQNSDSKWGKELLGGGLRAFLLVSVLDEESTHQITVTTTIIYLDEGSLAITNN